MLKREGRITTDIVRVITRVDLNEEKFKKALRLKKIEVFQAFFERLRNIPEFIRLKVYDEEGTIVWSDEARAIGKNFKDNKELKSSLAGNIEIKNLYFGYNPEIEVLKDINFSVDKNTIVSIVGSSGSGKTTLLRLLINMETAQKGSIYYDGMDSAKIPLNELRKQITVIWQEFSMFKGTIRDNLTIGLNDVDEKLIKTAVELARMDTHINALPQKLDTPISEWGSSLSGGQRQRLAIARAVIRNTPIIIFDEATSNIDMKTEAAILKDLFYELKNKTILFVTHRLSSAALADKVCYLENGEVVDAGSYSDLMERCESFRKMNTPERNVILKSV